MGRIGRAVADRARSFGMEIHYYNRSQLGKDLEKGAIYHKSLKSLYLDQKKYILSPGGKDTYRIKKRSNTRNSNIIFTLTFNPKNTIDNGLKKLKDRIVSNI